jgi:hypothetical protein
VGGAGWPFQAVGPPDLHPGLSRYFTPWATGPCFAGRERSRDLPLRPRPCIAAADYEILWVPGGRMGPVKCMGHMGLMGHMRHFCRLWRPRLPLPTAPPAISACEASSISPGCNPGSPPQRGCTPCKGSSQMRPRQRPLNVYVEEGPVVKHRGTEEHRGVVASHTNHSRVRPNPSEFTSEIAGPAESRVLQSPRLHTRFAPNTQHSAESCPYRA